MRLRFFSPLLFATLTLAIVAPARAAETASLTDEQLLRAAGLSDDPEVLLGFIRTRTRAEADRDAVAVLIKKLSSTSVDEREKAIGELVSIGSPAVLQLRQASRDPDAPELASHTRRCLQFIEGQSATALSSAAVRLLAHKRPVGSAEALLDYLPFADNDTVAEELKTALSSLLRRDGKIEPAFLKGLEESSPLRRAVIVEVLTKSGENDVIPALRKLLNDAKPGVRMRVGLALADRKDAEAIVAIIEALADMPEELARPAEDYLQNLAGESAPKVPLGTDVASRKACRDAWAAWWKATDGDATLAEFKKRTLTDLDRDKVLALIHQLGDDDFNNRERAQSELQNLSGAVLPLLRTAAVNDRDEEVKKRAAKCIETIDKDRQSAQLPVKARLIGFRKPAGASEVLLGFLPFADDEPTFEEIRGALAAIAVRDGKPDALLVKALDDKLPLRRGVAAEALASGGGADERALARRLLKDPDTGVRLRVALALTAAREREAVAPLIDLLAELPPEKGWQAEAYLRTLAGDAAPNVYVAADAASRTKARDAWAEWWKKNEATADLGRPAGPRMLGYTLVISSQMGRIYEVGPDGRERWTIRNLAYPRDARVISGDRVLVAEQNANRVTEYNQRGEVIWQKQVNGNPMNAQRLSNGNTVIVMGNGIVEMNREGKEVFRYDRNNFYDIVCGTRGPDGTYAFCNHSGQVFRLDATGKEIKSFNTAAGNPWSIEILPNGRILMPLPNQGKVAEFDQDGRITWEAGGLNYPLSASRLPNGNTLVASQNSNKVVELNRGGRVVWEYASPNPDRPFRAIKR
jgi:HEAT repeat protein